MIIASWNVNSIKARLPRLLEWLEERKPDIACLQEIKTVDEGFPRAAIEDLGYNVAVHGQKTYNGVAILSRLPFDEPPEARLPGDDSDSQARYLEAVVSTDKGALRVASIYLPNGNPVDSEKFPYKLAWMDRLRDHAAGLLRYEENFVLAGDYNIIPDAGDVYNPKAWTDDALYCRASREKFQALMHLGLTDAFRACNDAPDQYTFWDYQRGAWAKDHGLRIDHLLLSPQAADRLKTCRIDKPVRGRERPSDHTPIWAELAL
ncbi:MAG: exodeoxyribonuclease III [Hyphomicrobiales bacterium]|nr:MAG: exodeoxyribonuclease III [Hyphomicrobiales bacterium]